MQWKKNNRRGQALISFVLALPCFLLVVALATLLIAGLLTKGLIYADTFSIARAHLYGNDLDRCTPSTTIFRGLDASLKKLRLRYECGERGEIRSNLTYGDSWSLLETRINLLRRSPEI